MANAILVMISVIFCGTLCTSLFFNGDQNAKGLSNNFPLLPDCQDKNVTLIFIADGATPFYAWQLELITQLVDVFASEHEDHRRRFEVGMAVSGSDAAGDPHISWVFEPGTFSDISKIKGAVIYDRTRTRTETSYLKEAVEFVDNSLKMRDEEMSAAARESNEKNTPQQPRTNVSQHGTLATHSDPNLTFADSVSGENNLGPRLSDSTSTVIILVFASQSQDSHTNNEPDPEKFLATTKLLIVSFTDGNSRYASCAKFVKNLCTEVQKETMLADHSLPILLCDRCFHGWFGPRPDNTQRTPFASASTTTLTYLSCYTLLSPGESGNYAFRAADLCPPHGASLVSIETEMEATYLSSALKQHCVSSEPSLQECAVGNPSIFIGLRRNTNSLGKRFRWMNGRPLIYSHWMEDRPLGGLLQGCAVWKLGSQEASEQRSSDHLGAWEDVGCGQRMFGLSLCEWTKLLNPEKIKANIPLPHIPSFESTWQAISRGQVAICNGFSGEVINANMMLMALQFLVTSPTCSVFVNNSGLTQAVSLPLPRDRVFYCNSEAWGSVEFSTVCNRKRNCVNNEDENIDICYSPYLRREKLFRCSSGLQVDTEARCDLHLDCEDESDEENCEGCRFGLCSDGRCVPQPWLIDGEADCITFSQHTLSKPDLDISVYGEKDCAFLCNRTQCVPWDKLGDGVLDCLGPEGPLDESLGALERADCGNLSMEWAPKCIYQKDRLGELIGCRNMNHLHDCEHFVCPEGYVKCPGSYCIPIHYISDKNLDCPMGEEDPGREYMPDILTGHFKCSVLNEVFIHPDRICDGSADCLDGTDEESCHVTCANGFLCIGGFVVPDTYDRSVPLTSLSFVDSRTRMLELSGIDLSYVLPSIASLQLNYLIDLRLSHCSITDVNMLHHGMYRVTWLDLSYNLLSDISVSDDNPNLRPIFYQMINLQKLNLSYNEQLKVFDPSSVVGIYELRVLDLSHTALSIFPYLLDSVYSLTHLNLSHTRIKRISASVSPTTKPKTLQILDLRGVGIEKYERGALGELSITQGLYGDDFKLCCPQLRGTRIPAHVCHAPDDPLSSCSNLLQNPLLRVLVWVMGVASVLCNTGVILTRVAAGKTTLQLPYAKFVTQLGLSDFLMGVYLLIIAAKDVQYSGDYVWYYDDWRRSSLCKVAGFLSTLSSEVSSFFILLITVDRYLVIKYPFGQHRLSPANTLILSGLAWGLGLILATVPLLPGTRHWNLYSSNAVCLGLPLLPDRTPGWQFSVAVFIVFNFIICILIATGQATIYTVVSRNRRAAPVTTSTNGNAFTTSDEFSPRLKQDLALARRLAAVAFTDLLCWLPIAVMGLLALGGHGLGGEAYAWTAVFVMPVNSALNPLLYSLPVIKNRLARALAKCTAPYKKETTRSENDTSSTRM